MKTDLGLTHLMKHDIDVGDAAPVWQPQYRLPHAYQPHETIALNFQLAWQNARDNLQQHQRHQKQHYDKAAIPSKITPGSKVLIWRNTIKPGLSSKLTHQFTGPYWCIRIEGNHIFLTPIDKPNAKPFSWHIDHAKLAHTVDRTIIGLNLTNDQLRKLQTKNKIQYPIEHPAQHRHDLRSKRRVENQ